MSIFYKWLQSAVSQMIYPVKKQDWYRDKGYSSFEDFITIQQGMNPEKPSMFKDMESLDAERTKVTAKLTDGKNAELDTVTLKSNVNQPQDKPGSGKHIIYFFGRNEPLEVKWREMASDAKNIGATVHAFNLPGMGKSTGKMVEFNDAVNSGIAQVNALLKQGINPNDIILKGNCFGASVATEVKHKCSINPDGAIQLRLINSNSYRTLRDVVLEAIPFLLKFILQFVSLLNYTGWNPKVEEKFLGNDPHDFIVYRVADRTIGENAKLSAAMQQHRDSLIAGGMNIEELKIRGYEKDQIYFDKYSVMQLKQNQIDGGKDPHVAQMGEMEWIDENGQKRESWELFAEYIKRSNSYISTHLYQEGLPQGFEIQGFGPSIPPRISHEERVQHRQLVNEIIRNNTELGIEERRSRLEIDNRANESDRMNQVSIWPTKRTAMRLCREGRRSWA